jgi:two-component system chemotaxis response regulator CheY
MAYNVLVVDDSRIMRDMVAKAVQMSGLDIAGIDTACDGKQALEKLRSSWFDLVLLDVNMPVMTGEQFLVALRADVGLRDTLVVVVSTESSLPRIARLKAMGAGFVHKPFKPEELVTAVRQLLEAPRAEGT